MVCRGAGSFISRLIVTHGTPRPLRTLSCTSAVPSLTRTTRDSPVRAPPRLPRRSCRPSSLSCLLNFSDFPGPEATSGLLHFRHGMGGGDNMWSSCREKDRHHSLGTHHTPLERKTNQSHVPPSSASSTSLCFNPVFNLARLENVCLPSDIEPGLLQNLNSGVFQAVGHSVWVGHEIKFRRLWSVFLLP